MSKREKYLKIRAKFIPNGLSIIIENKSYNIEFPKEIWKKTPKSIRQVLLENLTFGNTHFLPLILDKGKIIYKIKTPLFESFLFKNQLYDLLFCERTDNVDRLSYLKSFYNLDYEFQPGESEVPKFSEIKNFRSNSQTAILPFSFGKESLITLGLCLELGIKPIVVYCQEPAHPYEEEYKRRKLKEIREKFNLRTYFIKNEPGLFRYGIAFGKKLGTEIGWGTQTTLLVLLSLPFVFAHQAGYIFLGNEYSNNEFESIQGWKAYSSYDQTSFWTSQQNNLIRLLTNNQCQVKSTLEPLEEITNFYILHHRYKKLAKFQFSCSGQKPLYKDSQWCHQCYKCSRMFLLSRCCEIDPHGVGFKKDLLKKNLFQHYFGKEVKTGSPKDLDFSFFILHKRKFKDKLILEFKKKKLKSILPWRWYRDNYTQLKESPNLPEKYRRKILAIFSEELRDFERILPK